MSPDLNDPVAYKVLTAPQFAALCKGAFAGAPVDRRDGYIHLSTAAQLAETLDRHFAGQDGMVIAAVDLAACAGELRWEVSRGGALFPHLYAPLTMELVICHGPVRRHADGTMILPDRRCGWAQTSPLLRHYHDREWGVPLRDPRALWELLMLEGFQAGLAWITVLRKREAFRQAFASFDPQAVARFGEADILRLLADPGIIRSGAKIEATVSGARIYLDMAAKGEDFSKFCWSFTGGQVIDNRGAVRLVSSPLSEQVSRALKERGFKFVGPVIVYAWLQAAGIINDHDADCFRRGG